MNSKLEIIKEYKNPKDVESCEILKSLKHLKSESWIERYESNHILFYNDQMGGALSYATLYKETIILEKL